MLRRTLIAAVMLSASPCFAATLTVQVDGVGSSEGKVGCALFSQPGGFPGRSGSSVTQVRSARAGGVSCVFQGVKPGTYAVSVIHDKNGNGRLDTNFLGIPKEAWGVSNGARPAMRAPSFAEAAFAVSSADRTIRVKLASF